MRNRLLFILWLFALALLWIPAGSEAAGMILADSILAEAILAAYAGFYAGRVKLRLDLKGSYSGEKEASLIINADYGGILPVKLRLKVMAQNSLTGEKGLLTFEELISPGGKKKESGIFNRGISCQKENPLQIELKSPYAGKIRMQIEAAYIADIFGVLRFRIKKIDTQNLTCLLLPRAATAPQIQEILYSYEQSSDVYAEDRPGQDQSNPYELRDYRNGDDIRRIHWKLSSKTENWILREGSYPVGYRLLLLMENSYEEKSGAKSPEAAIEKACGTVISLSEELTDRGISHHIGWWSDKYQEIQTTEIRSADDLASSLGEILGATLEKRKKTIWERFLESYPGSQFSQIIVIDDETTKNYRL